MVSCRSFDVLVDITSRGLPINPLPLSPESWYTFDYRPEQQHRFPGRLCVHVSQYWFLRAPCSDGLWVVVMDRLMSRWRMRRLTPSYRKWIASFWCTSARRLRISLVVFCHREKATMQTCGQWWLRSLTSVADTVCHSLCPWRYLSVVSVADTICHDSSSAIVVWATFSCLHLPLCVACVEGC